jgi:hypothetical protein
MLMADEDPRRFNIRSTEGEYLCPSCGFPGHFHGDSYDQSGPQIATGICPCCLWEPGYDDVPAASGAPDRIVEALKAYRRGWTALGPAWNGKPECIPAAWDRKAQLERLFKIAPWLK